MSHRIGRVVAVGKMSKLIDGYVSYKRSLGYKIRTEAQTLGRFASYADLEHPGKPLSREVALGWIATFDGVSEWYKARLWETVRTFSRYACVVDDGSILLPKGPGKCHGRHDPYIYEDAEVLTQMRALSEIHSPDGLRAASASAMCGLMRACGLRPAECCRLKVLDYDAKGATLSVIGTKFNKSRYVPLSDSAAAHVEEHLASLPFAFPDSPLFPRTGGRPFDVRALEYAWQQTRDTLLPKGQTSWERRPPRPYDLRHTMATKTLEGWLSSGKDVDAMMPYLSSYLGHEKVADTYWYLSGTEALLGSASDMFEAYVLGGDSHE